MKYLLVLSLFIIGCTNNNEAITAMTDHGFSNVTVTNSGSILGTWHGCGQEDTVWYEVRATNTSNKQVNMMVCCGGPLSFKGCTIRSK